MKTDLYTRTVLTVIAACLVYICLGGPNLMPSASAQNSVGPAQDVVIVGWKPTPRSMSAVQELERQPLPVVEKLAR